MSTAAMFSRGWIHQIVPALPPQPPSPSLADGAPGTGPIVTAEPRPKPRFSNRPMFGNSTHTPGGSWFVNIEAIVSALSNVGPPGIRLCTRLTQSPRVETRPPPPDSRGTLLVNAP